MLWQAYQGRQQTDSFWDNQSLVGNENVPGGKFPSSGLGFSTFDTG